MCWFKSASLGIQAQLQSTKHISKIGKGQNKQEQKRCVDAYSSWQHVLYNSKLLLCAASPTAVALISITCLKHAKSGTGQTVCCACCCSRHQNAAIGGLPDHAICCTSTPGIAQLSSLHFSCAAMSACDTQYIICSGVMPWTTFLDARLPPLAPLGFCTAFLIAFLTAALGTATP